VATGYPHSLILIGAEEDFPEIEHGWIEPGRVIVDSPTACLHRVRHFWSDLLVTWRAMESLVGRSSGPLNYSRNLFGPLTYGLPR